MKNEIKIGFFGGTFDPIHFGHIHLAIQMLEIHQLDHVLFCPAFCSPLKSEELPMVEDSHRATMTGLAINDIEKFLLYTGEVDRKGLSYTIDTIRYLIKDAENSGVNKKFYLILGEDALPNLGFWKESEELFRLAPPLIGSRLASTSFNLSSLPPFLAQKCKEGITKMPILEISSTELRLRLKKRLYCGHLVPAKVLDYIYENGLYYL